MKTSITIVIVPVLCGLLQKSERMWDQDVIRVSSTIGNDPSYNERITLVLAHFVKVDNAVIDRNVSF